MDPKLDEIIQFLNHAQIRATYGAVAACLGVAPISMGARLGPRQLQASWIVRAETGLPTGYAAHELHPALRNKTEIIDDGPELERRVEGWKRRRDHGNS